MLIGEHVILRVIQQSDTEMVRVWKNSPDNYNFFANRNFVSDSMQQDWFEKKLKEKSGLYLIILDKGTEKPIGMTLLESIDHRNQNASWGIYIADTDFRKRIYAVESVILLFDYAFDYLNLQKIYGNTLESNPKGRAFHNLIGFSEEAVFYNHVYLEGKFTNLIWIALFKKNWQKRRKELGEIIVTKEKN